MPIQPDWVAVLLPNSHANQVEPEQCVALCCSLLQCVQCVAVCFYLEYDWRNAVCYCRRALAGILYCVAVCCSVVFGM